MQNLNERKNFFSKKIKKVIFYFVLYGVLCYL